MDIRERLTVRHLGPLEDVSIEILPITVFLGESGVGKSLLLKVLAMMRHICKKNLVRNWTKRAGLRQSTFRLRKEAYLRFADIGHLVSSDTDIFYDLTVDGETWRFDFKSLKGCCLSVGGGAAGTLPSVFFKVAFVSDTRNLIPYWDRKGASMQSKVLDNYFAETYELWDSALSLPEMGRVDFPRLGLAVSVSRDKGGRREVTLTDKRHRAILLRHSASGHKSVIALAVIVKYLTGAYDFADAIRKHCYEGLLAQWTADNTPLETVVAKLKKHAVGLSHFLALHIEEPEISLDPNTQIAFAKDLMQMIMSAHLTVGPNENGASLPVSAVFTTHSPYWIQVLNVLLQERSVPGFDRSCVTGYWLKDGRAECIMDPEDHLLITPNLDEAFLELDERFGQALMVSESDGEG